jgi:hypothetical protein
VVPISIDQPVGVEKPKLALGDNQTTLVEGIDGGASDCRPQNLTVVVETDHPVGSGARPDAETMETPASEVWRGAEIGHDFAATQPGPTDVSSPGARRYPEPGHGPWLSLVERLSGGQEVVGSNPAGPTITSTH